MLSDLSCNIELREKGEEREEDEVVDEEMVEVVRGKILVARSPGWVVRGAGGAGGEPSSPGLRLCSKCELRPLASAITAY